MAADPPLYGADQSRFARYLERREARSPDLVARELRRRLLAGLRGRVLELGCGDGRAFEHYPPAVTGGSDRSSLPSLDTTIAPTTATVASTVTKAS